VGSNPKGAGVANVQATTLHSQITRFKRTQRYVRGLREAVGSIPGRSPGVYARKTGTLRFSTYTRNTLLRQVYYLNMTDSEESSSSSDGTSSDSSSNEDSGSDAESESSAPSPSPSPNKHRRKPRVRVISLSA